MKTLLVYIAAPYSKGDQAVNTRTAMLMWDTLFDLGFFPFCPHLTHFLHLLHPRPYDDWMRYDKEWIRVCHALLRLPGLSSGADSEILVAKTLGMPVFYNVKDLKKWAKLQ